jgi:hypothetical protein
MVELMNENLRTPVQPFERGTKYFIRIRKQAGFTPRFPEYYLRFLFRHLWRTPLEDTSIVQIGLPKCLLLFTSHIHPDDANAISKLGAYPEVEIRPIVEDVEYGRPYFRTFCVNFYPNRKSIHPPRVAKYLSNYRWVVYTTERGNKHGILISEEPNTFVPELRSSHAYLITACLQEDIIYYKDLSGENYDYRVPLSYPCP